MVFQHLTYEFFQNDFHYCVTLRLNMVGDHSNMCPVFDNIYPPFFIFQWQRGYKELCDVSYICWCGPSNHMDSV